MTLYRAAYETEVVDFMAQGYSLTAFAGHIGQPFDIVCDWIRDCPEFATAVAKARAKRVMSLEATFITTENSAKVSSHKHALNNAAPHEWRDRVEHTGADGGPIVIAAALEEARRRAAIDVQFEPVSSSGALGASLEPKTQGAPAAKKTGIAEALAKERKR